MKTFVYTWGVIGLGLVLLFGGAAPVFGQNEENKQSNLTVEHGKKQRVDSSTSMEK